MFKLINIFAVAALTITGCSSANSQARNSTASSSVVCDQCNATWVQKSVVNDKGVRLPQAVTAKGATVCETCQRAAQESFATGTTVRCRTCDGKMKVVEA